MSPSKPGLKALHTTGDAVKLNIETPIGRKGSLSDLCIDDTAPTVKASTLEELHAKQRKSSLPATPKGERIGTQADSIR